MAHLSANLSASSSLISAYHEVRQRTVALTRTLSDADATIQSMEDASPAKWHLAHTTWFFETFILCAERPDYKPFNRDYAFLFNSYYEGAGERHARTRRGLITRPSLDDVRAYRAYVDAHMDTLITADMSETLAELILLGLNHEEQHQELLLTDILHLMAQNPLRPAVFDAEPLAVEPASEGHPGWTQHEGGITTVGNDGAGFAFDCETPQHDTLLQPFALANRAVTNREWAAFIADKGYETVSLWLSDGWATRSAREWKAPLYWALRDDEWWSMTLYGFQPVNLDAPVAHISFYEADAFASWAGARLPTEQEWEALAVRSNVSDTPHTEHYRPQPQIGHGLRGLFHDVWEWTASAFRPYPGFTPLPGTIGEYNGKFMSGQMVLKGASCATPPGHSRATYRNFFQPDKRWQFSGLRLAKDA